MKIKPHISGIKRIRWENTVREAASRVDRPKPRSPYNVCCVTPSDKSNIKILKKSK